MSAPPSVLIAGAGPTGLVAALELVRRGFRPRIVDAGSGPTPLFESRALAVHNRTLQLLGPSGVTERMLAQGNRMERIVLCEEAGPFLTLDFTESGAPFPFVLVLAQARTERLLIEALAERGLEVEWNTEVVAASWEGNRPRVVLRAPDREEGTEMDVLVGADGARSIVRRSCGFKFEGEGFPAEFGLVDARLAQPSDPTEGRIRFFRDGVIASFPITADLVRYVGPELPETAKLLEGQPVVEVPWQSRFHVSFRHVGSMHRGPVYLAGDAAHVHSPVGGRGMNLGIEDAAWLAFLLEQGRGGEYTKWRLPTVKRVIRFTKEQTQQLQMHGSVIRFARTRLAPAAMSIPRLRRWVLGRVMGLDSPEPPWLER